MRDVAYSKFDVEQASDFIFHVPATERQIEDFAENDEAELAHWQWDFNPGYLESAWNIVQMERLVDAAVEEDDKGMGYVRQGFIQREYLEIVMAEQLERYRGDWKQFQPRWLAEKRRLETNDEALARGKVVLFIRRMASKTINAQHRVCGIVLQIHSLNSSTRNTSIVTKLWKRRLL